jgi:glutamate/tyrosine decarboxylase-like PLP-dependent enzyme
MQQPPPVDDLNWSAERSLAFLEGVASIWGEVLEGIGSRTLPVTTGTDVETVRAAVALDVPDAPMDPDALLSYLRTLALEEATYPGHPRFMAYITGSGTAPGAAADLLAAGLNMNAGGWLLGPAATEVELHLTRWFAQEVFGMPATAAGQLTSGGAMANFIALKAARDLRAGWDVRHQGVAAGPPLGFYLSSQTHTVSQRGLDMLGIGWDQVRVLPAREDYRFDLDVLRAAIAEDVAAGVKPVAVVGSAGTVLTGVVDPLDELADVCAEHGLWFHVDAAYGGPAMLAEDLRPLFGGIERADSIAFDPHKWLYTPQSGGCLLVREFASMAEVFDVAHVAYIHRDERWMSERLDLGRVSPNFSRGFWALKVWVSLLAHGRDAYARRISHDAELARYLGARAQERPDFELCTPVGLSITCFRYLPPDLPQGEERESYLNELNRELVARSQRDGRVMISNAELLGDVFALRTCVVNHRTEAQDMDAVLEVIAELGAAIDAERRPLGLRP